MRIAVFALALAFACKSAPPKPEAAAPAPATGEEAAQFYPLQVGNSWTYGVRGSPKRETIEIVGRDGPWFIDDHQGRLRYERDGVRDADRYLLRSPLRAGARWSSVENLAVQRFEVTSMEASLVTEAGTFTGCVQVRNEEPLPKGGKFVTEWTYARRVGLVQVVTSTIDAQGKQAEQTRIELVAYHLQ
jgi:hypothetical protein